MKILHVSAECYPAAKAGGLGDVVGALPKYLAQSGTQSGVIIPKYALPWMESQSFIPIYKGAVRLHNQFVPFTIEKERTDQLGFPLFVANIPGQFDRPGIYKAPNGGWYEDEVERFLCFQQAVLEWIVNAPGKPQVLHCHDHHTGLIPFLVKHSPTYQLLKDIPTVFTIHNGAYHGAFSWEKMYLLPFFDGHGRGLLDWNNAINPLATAIKSAWRITAVSPSYLEELKENANGIEPLVAHEKHKALGILNGIDTKVWSPVEDTFIARPLEGDWTEFKQFNKRVLAQRFNIDRSFPIITFIGRMVKEKGADLLPDLIERVLQSGVEVAFLLLGTGEAYIEKRLLTLKKKFAGRLDVAIEYNEALAHQLYAGADFLLMPSRVEPCGLNQMYAMRYGTIPIVRAVGGLKDTVIDLMEGEDKGRGIRFNNFDLNDAFVAIFRAAELYQNKALLKQTQARISEIDFSWERSANAYKGIYDQLTHYM